MAFTEEAALMFEAAAAAVAAGDGDGAAAAAELCTVSPDGSYCHGPAPTGTDLSQPDCHRAAFEMCLVLPPQPQPLQQQPGVDGPEQRRRLRLVHNLQRMGSGAGGAAPGWQLASLDLHLERYDSPYRGECELRGCGGGMPAFASGERLAAGALGGAWVASGLRYGGDGAAPVEVVDGELRSLERLPSVLLHPLNAWSSCHVDGDGVSLAAGVLLDEGGGSGGGARMALATRRLVGGRLAGAELLTLTRAAAATEFI